MHARSEFTFTVPLAMADAFPLFGPEGERAWAGPSWQPETVHPQPAADVEGAVFRVRRGEREATWVNALFDAHAGRAIYVHFLPGLIATRIDVRLDAAGPRATAVHVVYERTALHPSAADEVRELGRTDGEQGPEWQTAIVAHLARRQRVG
jgi:hypothetical protein